MTQEPRPGRLTPEDAILAAIDARDDGKTICPTDAAKVLDPENWRARLHQIRAAGVHLARTGVISIYRKGKPVSPDGFKGVYRLGRPPAGSAQSSGPAPNPSPTGPDPD
jgi:hypothetical protein